MAGSYGKSGKQKTVRDMVLSLGLIGLMAGVIYLFIPHDDSDPEVKRVDYRVELLTARRAASYPVLAPEGLSADWKATSVRYDGADAESWHLGFSTPGGEYAQIEQSATQKPEAFIDTASQGGEKTQTTTEIGGRTWTRYDGGRYDALVHEGEGATTVVAGTGGYDQLARMAKALKAK
ncbi:DUF4245 domain-containing protein [Streptomyces justiciae]|uniref:DUF4245 domain-containing protein n=1 Tax=Streptomyces justiciae TaxID=2780140 RepID=A0ABU3LPD0_9ACTN|nr:DUF4245 domain-containing protein [Streptomyces justiciae]MDT7841018.1 DUF4245 domain-containing protein [Streptomyces justiciae]